MVRKEEIVHVGKIISITPEITKVEITAGSACGACAAAEVCRLAETEKKVVEVPTEPSAVYKEGQEVEVCLAQRLGSRAALLAYGLPVLLLTGVTVSLSFAGAAEWLAALAGLAGLGLYYLTLRLFRDRMAGDYVFRIRERK